MTVSPEDGPSSGGEGRSKEERSRDERARQRLDIPDLLRRTFYAGLGAIFTSEEGIRRLANDFSLPKDMANYLITQAGTTKNELFRVFATELRRFLESMRLNEELQRLLASMSIEVTTQVRFVPHDEELRPNVKRKVRVKRARKEPEPVCEPEPAEDDPEVQTEPPAE